MEYELDQNRAIVENFLYMKMPSVQKLLLKGSREK